ncbi:MAG: AAA-like domain-containing protein [Eubacteriaceae bacterium]|nr:AAA-like domain-containing protein [Eubacteriaceae bacterium]
MLIYIIPKGGALGSFFSFQFYTIILPLSNTIVKKAEDYYERGIIIINCSMNSFANPESFFKGIVDTVYEVLEDYDDIDVKIERRYNKVVEATLEEGCVKNIQSFFKLLLKSGKRVICVIDEFDHSRKLFSNFSEGFNILRELAYQPETDVTFIFISRRMIAELESSAGISTLANILGKPIYVKGYNDEELEDYYLRNEIYGISISEADKEQVLNITGSQPYWLDILMYHYVQSAGENKDFESLFNENCGVFYNEYERLLTLLDEQHLLEKLYQIVIGPAYDYTKADVQKLYDYGIIGIENGQATLQSKKLLEYMEMKEGVFDFYPLWNRTERRMRNLLKYKLKEKYGDTWEEQIKELYIKPECHHMSLGGYLSTALDLQNKVSNQKDLYIQTASYSIIEALTTAGLFAFYVKEYKLFQTALGMDKNEFSKITAHLTKARNPYQHNNDDLIDPAFKSLTKGYCELLNKKIDLFEECENLTI